MELRLERHRENKRVRASVQTHSKGAREDE